MAYYKAVCNGGGGNPYLQTTITQTVVHSLSKSTYLRGLQCQKSLWLNKYYPQYRDKPDKQQQAVFDMGHLVGKTAQKLFDEGVDATRGDYFKIHSAVEYTKRLIEDKQKVIYEAAFIFNGVLCYVDLLVYEGGKWRAYEVKGSTGLKGYYLDDTALQYYTITGAGLDIEDMFVVYLNNQYIRQGELDIRELFIIESVYERVIKKQGEVKRKIEESFNTLELPFPPDTDIGPYCTEPYTCDFTGYCWQHIPAHSVFTLHNLRKDKKFELYYQGVTKPEDIPTDYKMGRNQWLQVESYANKEIIADKENIRDFLDKLKYPLYFIDFESFQPPVPLYENSRPYQQIVFQYSMHLKYEKESTSLAHIDFLGDPLSDPRIPFIESLLNNLGMDGDIIVYNRSFECGRLKDIARDFPQYKDQIGHILTRIVDLMEPFQKKYLYTPEMNGSYSIKQVLPALEPELNYNNLEIGSGGIASLAFGSLLNIDNEDEKEKIRKNLLEYCKMDTYAMVKILNRLYEALSI